MGILSPLCYVIEPTGRFRNEMEKESGKAERMIIPVEGKTAGSSFSATLRKRPLDIPKGGAFRAKRGKKAERYLLYKLFLIEEFLD